MSDLTAPEAALREWLARWLQAAYSRTPPGPGMGARTWDDLSDRARSKWRDDADELIGRLRAWAPR